MGKLVRDLIPEIIESSGRTPITRVLDGPQYRKALLDKLFEESAELRDAEESDKPEELADVLEVVMALASDLGLAMTDLTRIADRKRTDRGGFAERIWLE